MQSSHHLPCIKKKKETKPKKPKQKLIKNKEQAGDDKSKEETRVYMSAADSQVSDNSTNNFPYFFKPVNKFTEADAGPFKIVLMKVRNKESESQPPKGIQISLLLEGMKVDFYMVERLSMFKWMVSFPTRRAANEALANQELIDAQFTMAIPWYMIYRKIVVPVPPEHTIEEITTELEDSNPCLNYEYLYRLKKRTGQQLVDLDLVAIIVRSCETPPEYLYLWKTRLETMIYIPGIRQCYKCGRLDHFSRFCQSTEKCHNCGRDKHVQVGTCHFPSWCTNCGGNHYSLHLDCPEVITKKQLLRVMATVNLDYHSMREVVIASESYPKTVHLQMITPPVLYYILSDDDRSCWNEIMCAIKSTPNIPLLLNRIKNTCSLHVKNTVTCQTD